MLKVLFYVIMSMIFSLFLPDLLSQSCLAVG